MRTDTHQEKTSEKRTIRFASAGFPVLFRLVTREHVEYGSKGTAQKAPLTKTNPPYPPLTGGYKKAKPGAGGGAFVFSCPPDKGGWGVNSD